MHCSLRNHLTSESGRQLLALREPGEDLILSRVYSAGAQGCRCAKRSADSRHQVRRQKNMDPIRFVVWSDYL